MFTAETIRQRRQAQKFMDLLCDIKFTQDLALEEERVSQMHARNVIVVKGKV